MQNILNSIKTMLGISEMDNYFDPTLIMHINLVFVILQQMGIGPQKGFSLVSQSETWNDYLDENDAALELVKTYMFMKVKLMFDPPVNSTLSNLYNQNISELEWRLSISASFNEEEVNV